jgi:hypothetical protein
MNLRLKESLAPRRAPVPAVHASPRSKRIDEYTSTPPTVSRFHPLKTPPRRGPLLSRLLGGKKTLSTRV